MNNNLLYTFLTANNVPAEELGKNWQLFEIIAVALAILPWIALVIYLIFLRKYRIRYFVNGELVHEELYKKNAEINHYAYENINNWYTDIECTIVFSKKSINENIKLYGKIE